MEGHSKKVVDLMSYRITKSLKENGFEVKIDNERKVKLVIKLKNPE